MPKPSPEDVELARKQMGLLTPSYGGMADLDAWGKEQERLAKLDATQPYWRDVARAERDAKQAPAGPVSGGTGGAGGATPMPSDGHLGGTMGGGSVAVDGGAAPAPAEPVAPAGVQPVSPSRPADQQPAMAPQPRPGAMRGRGGPRRSGFKNYLASQYGEPARKHRLGEPLSAEDQSVAVQDEFAQRANFEDQQQAEQQAREEQRRNIADALQDQEAIDMELAARQTERLNKLKQAESRFQEMADAITAEPIDSNRMWANASTGDKVFKVLGLLLAGAAGGPEGAQWGIGQINAQIERDIDEQKANKALQQSRLAAEGTLIGMARERFATEDAIDAAMRESAYRRVQVQLEHLQDVAQDPVRQAQLQTMRDQLDSQINEAARQRRLAVDQYELQLQAARARGGGMSPAQKRLKELKLMNAIRQEKGLLQGRDLAAEAKASAKGQGGEKLVVPGLGKARTELEARQMREELANYNMFKANIRKARELAGDSGSALGAFGYGTKAYNQADALESQMVTQVAKSYGGVITDADRDSAKKEMPSLTSVGKGWRERLDLAERKVDSNFKKRVQATIVDAPQAPDAPGGKP